MTNQRPDALIISRETKSIVILELTIPWEDRMDEAYERKAAKYQDLVMASQDKGWKAWCFPIEIGCRGYLGRSASRALNTLGLEKREKATVLREAGEQAERSSNWLWLRRNDPNWTHR